MSNSRTRIGNTVYRLTRGRAASRHGDGANEDMSRDSQCLTAHTTPLFVRKEPPAARTRCPSCSIVLTAPRGKHLSSTTQKLPHPWQRTTAPDSFVETAAPLSLSAARGMQIAWEPPSAAPPASTRAPLRPPRRRPLFQPASPSCLRRPARGRWLRRRRGSCGARARRGSVARRGGRSGRHRQRHRGGAPNALESMCGHDLEWSPQSSAGSRLAAASAEERGTEGGGGWGCSSAGAAGVWRPKERAQVGHGWRPRLHRRCGESAAAAA